MPARDDDSPFSDPLNTTHWSVVIAAGRSQSSQSDSALATLCETYWYPLYAFVRRQGFNAEEAEDLTQDFFAKLLEKNYVGDADQPHATEHETAVVEEPVTECLGTAWWSNQARGYFKGNRQALPCRQRRGSSDRQLAIAGHRAGKIIAASAVAPGKRRPPHRWLVVRQGETDRHRIVESRRIPFGRFRIVLRDSPENRSGIPVCRVRHVQHGVPEQCHYPGKKR